MEQGFVGIYPVPILGISCEFSWNPHVPEYETVEDHLRDMDYLDVYEYVSDEDRQRILDTGNLFVYTWNPKTPLGFRQVAASDFLILYNHIMEKHQ